MTAKTKDIRDAPSPDNTARLGIVLSFASCLCDNYYTGVRDMMLLTDPEWDAKQEALSRLIQRKPKNGRGVGSNVMEKF